MPRPKHLTRKEITQDRIRLLLVETWEQVIEYRNYLLAAVGVAILAGIGYWGIDTIQARRAMAAQEELSGALKIFNTIIPKAEDPEQPEEKLPYTNEEDRDEQALRRFRQIADQQGWTQIGELARFYIGVTQQRLKHYQEALESFSEIIDQSSSLEMRNLSRNRAALVALQLGRREQAIEAWNEILDEPSTHVPTSDVMENLAKAYDAAGQKAEALDLFKRLKEENPSLPDAASIEARIALLETETASQEEPQPVSEEGETNS